jgi:ribonuclease G
MRELATRVEAEALLIQMNPRVSQEFTGHDARVLRAIEADTGKWFHFEGSEGLPLEHFAVLMEADRQQVLERALPFREGEEVYLEIIEPHMYSAGNGVAKVDGYIISVRGAEDAVGQKRLVRIEQVGRTEAVAVPIDQPPVKLREQDTEPVAKPAARRRRATAKSEPAAAASEPTSAKMDPAPVAGEPATEAEAVAEAQAATDGAEPEAPSTRAPRRSRSRRSAKPPAEASSESVADAPEPADAGDPQAAATVSDEPSATESAEVGVDGVESTVRRRGRRGGRRRSTAKAGSAATAEESSSE